MHSATATRRTLSGAPQGADLWLATRVEHAALNATAVREQMLYDGWLVRWSPGETKRTRSINVVAPPVTPFESRFDFCRRWYARQGLPMTFRIASHGPDHSLDGQLESRGLQYHGATCVMALDLPCDAGADAPTLAFEQTDCATFSRAVGTLRGLGTEAAREHQRRLETLAVDVLPLVARQPDGRWAAAGLVVLDDDIGGLFDIVVAPSLRRQGLGRATVTRLLMAAQERGARTAYLQVEQDNEPARRLYGAYGFRDIYTYWYRSAAQSA